MESRVNVVHSQPSESRHVGVRSTNDMNDDMDVDEGHMPLRIAQLRRESLLTNACPEMYPMLPVRRRFHKKRRIGLKSTT